MSSLAKSSFYLEYWIHNIELSWKTKFYNKIWHISQLKHTTYRHCWGKGTVHILRHTNFVLSKRTSPHTVINCHMLPPPPPCCYKNCKVILQFPLLILLRNNKITQGSGTSDPLPTSPISPLPLAVKMLTQYKRCNYKGVGKVI